MSTTYTRPSALGGVCLTVLLSATSFCGAAPKKADPAATARAKQDIQAVYDRQAKGLAAKDVNAVFSGVAPDAVTTELDGKSETAAEGRQMISTLMPLMKHADAVNTIQSIMLEGDSAVVVVKQHSHMVLMPPKQPMTDLVIDDVSRDMWIKTPGGWKMKTSKDLTEVVKQNGKVVSKK
jgi:ketosteroid isomerase-like protein